MNDSKAAIIKASKLPMSVVVAGGVTAPTEVEMRALDDDDRPLSASGEYSLRDVFKYVKTDLKAHGVEVYALSEIPRQVVTYLGENGIKPKM